jgi:hypothetical protein
MAAGLAPWQRIQSVRVLSLRPFVHWAASRLPARKRQLVARTFRRFLLFVALAVALEQLPTTIAPFCASAWAQGNTYPPGYAPPDAANPGYGAMPAIANNYGPTSPTPPGNPSRPASWPGGPNDGGSSSVAPPGGAMPGAPGVPAEAVPQTDPTEPPYEPAAILAHVGTEVIQAADILPTVHQTLDGHLSKLGAEFQQLPADVKQDRLKQWQRELVQYTLADMIKIKLLLLEVKSAAPAEAIKKNVERIRKDFNENEIKRLMTSYKATSVVDLENKLRAQGGSIESQRTLYIERIMAFGWLRQQIKDQKEPTHEEMVTYYRDHATDWERPARARWEQLTARFDKFPNKADAWRAIAAWGNDVQRGVPLAQVAKAHSQGYSAEEGGLNDWTTQGSLRSKVLDEALFRLPVGVLSQIIEAEDGFHIVRVAEREDQRRIPFNEVQPDIKKKLEDGDQNQKMNEYLAKLRERTPITSVFEEVASQVATRPGRPAR